MFTHFPRNGNRPSIIGLTWSCSKGASLVTSWHAPPDGDHGSDHTSTNTMLTIARPVFTPRRMFSKCDWSSFADTIKYADHPGPPSLAADYLTYATFVEQIIDKAKFDSTPWSTARKRSAPRWNPDWSRLR